MSKLLAMSSAFGTFFLAACLCVNFLVPSAQKEEIKKDVSLFESITTEFEGSSEFDFLAEYVAKSDLFGGLASKMDSGLVLYREPQSRAAVEWFYTNITSSHDIATAILENAEKNDIPLSLAFALAYVESNYKIRAVNHNSNHTIDRGLFQLNSSSFPRLSEEDFFDPNVSARYGMKHLRFCLDTAGDEITAIAMYNAGTNRVKNNKTPQTTLSYVARIEKYRKMIDGMFDTEIVAFYDTTIKNRALAKR